MPSRASTSLLLEKRTVLPLVSNVMCQCPLGLVPHCYAIELALNDDAYINLVSMPSRASTSLLLNRSSYTSIGSE